MSVCLYVPVCACVCMSVCLYVPVCACVCMSVCLCVPVCMQVAVIASQELSAGRWNELYHYVELNCASSDPRQREVRTATH